MLSVGLDLHKRYSQVEAVVKSLLEAGGERVRGLSFPRGFNLKSQLRQGRPAIQRDTVLRNFRKAAHKLFKQNKCDGVVSVGGGSSHDCAKAVRIVDAHDGQSIREFNGMCTTKKPITIPQLATVMEFFIVISIITMLSWVFNYVYVMTGGGPGNATMVSELYVYLMGFRYNQTSLAAAVSVLLLIVTGVFIFIDLYLRDRSGSVEALS